MTTTTEKKPELKATIAELSTKLAEHIKIAKDGSTTISDNLFEKHLPDGLTTDLVDKVKDYTTNFIAAGTHAFGVAAVDAMKGTKALTEVTTTIGLGGKDNMQVTTKREETFVNRIDPNNPVDVTKYGVTTVKIEQYGHSSSKGTLKAVRNAIGARAQEVFGK